MTTTHPRDPRLRRAAHRDPLEAAVRLEVAVDEMRAGARDRGPADEVAADAAATAQLATVDPPLTAAEFAAALDLDEVPLERSRIDSWERAAEPPPVFRTEHGTPLEVAPRALTWRSRHDERSRLFGVRERLAGSAPVTDHLWPVGPTLDQGAEGACVGCGVVHATNTLRLAAAFATGGDLGMLTLEDAVDVYERAKELDPYPGEEYSGTSVLAGLQAAVEYSLIGGYLWAFGTRDIAQAVMQRGPVIVGVPWLSGMAETGPGGLVELRGDDVGAGHVLTVVGIRRTGPQGQPGPFFVWQNSWGESYGAGGLGYIHHRHLAELLRGVGEAAIPTRDPQAPGVTEPDALFPVAAVPTPPAGAVLEAFRALVAAALESGKLVDEDAALVEGTAVMAEALDTARRVGGLKGGYLAAQAFPPFQRGLHALRLPVELTAATPPAPAGDGQPDTPSWLRDAFGTAE